MFPACNFPFAKQDFSRISLKWLMNWISCWYTRHSLTIVTCRYTGFFPDIALIWLMDWFTCWYTRHSLMIGINGLINMFKFGIFPGYTLSADKNSYVKSGYFPIFFQNPDIFRLFRQNLGYFPVFSLFLFEINLNTVLVGKLVSNK
jgi:hypothetical protein